MRLLLLPVLLTTIVTLLRLVSELKGWAPSASGGAGFWLGITWLVPIFGIWFGWKLAGTDDPPRSRGNAFLRYLICVAIVFGGFFVNFRLFSEGVYDFRITFLIGALLWMIFAAVAWPAWPRLSRTLFVYGLFARIPVIVIAAISAVYDLGTHYDRIGPDDAGLTEQLTDTERIAATAAAQLCIWIPFTILVGGLFGSLAALFAPRHRPS